MGMYRVMAEGGSGPVDVAALRATDAVDEVFALDYYEEGLEPGRSYVYWVRDEHCNLEGYEVTGRETLDITSTRCRRNPSDAVLAELRGDEVQP